jgi:hypothetical protein
VSVPPDWDASIAVAACPIAPWNGFVWRGHRRRYEGLDRHGSLVASAGFHRAPDRSPPGQARSALYLGLSYGVCLGEVLRHLPQGLFSQVNKYRLSEIRVDLQNVIDCRDLARLQLRLEALFRDLDYTIGQELAAAVRQLGCEGMLVPLATGNPDANLIVFPDLLDPVASMSVVETVDPRLYVDRSGR